MIGGYVYGSTYWAEGFIGDAPMNKSKSAFTEVYPYVSIFQFFD